ncbi:glycoside hydrolase [Bacillota bacterium Lsc_1132]
MTLDVRTSEYSLKGILSAPPKITDQLNAVCRTLELKIQKSKGLENILGEPVELWYNGKCWFYGFIFKRGYDSKGNVNYTAYDPLFIFKRHEDDFYFTNQTATQGIRHLAKRAGVAVGSLQDTGVVFNALYYPAAKADKVAIDMLTRTGQANGKKYWLRFNPYTDDFGLKLFERKVPEEVWTFRAGVNLESAHYEESVEDMYNGIKLVNRETGKTVLLIDQASKDKFGYRQQFKEVDKDAVDTMDQRARQLLTNLSKVKATMDITGVNPNRTMPQFFSGDYIYVEEEYTGMYGAYNLLDVSHTFLNDNLVDIAANIQRTPDMLAIQYDKAETPPDYLK